MSWLYLCVGLESGCEAAVHTMQAIREDKSTKAILLADAQNAFNLLNGQLAVLNIHSICPIAFILAILYREDANLYVQNETVTSREGVMQGNPLAVAMIALGVPHL